MFINIIKHQNIYGPCNKIKSSWSRPFFLNISYCFWISYFFLLFFSFPSSLLFFFCTFLLYFFFWKYDVCFQSIINLVLFLKVLFGSKLHTKYKRFWYKNRWNIGQDRVPNIKESTKSCIKYKRFIFDTRSWKKSLGY